MKKQKINPSATKELPIPASPPPIKYKRKNDTIPSPKSNYQYYQQYCNVFTLNCHLLQQVSFSNIIDWSCKTRRSRVGKKTKELRKVQKNTWGEIRMEFRNRGIKNQSTNIYKI